MRAKIAATEIDANGHRRYAAELREIVGFARAKIIEGEARTSIATELGVGARLLGRWLKSQHRLLVYTPLVNGLHSSRDTR